MGSMRCKGRNVGHSAMNLECARAGGAPDGGHVQVPQRLARSESAAAGAWHARPLQGLLGYQLGAHARDVAELPTCNLAQRWLNVEWERPDPGPLAHASVHAWCGHTVNISLGLKPPL